MAFEIHVSTPTLGQAPARRMTIPASSLDLARILARNLLDQSAADAKCLILDKKTGLLSPLEIA